MIAQWLYLMKTVFQSIRLKSIIVKPIILFSPVDEWLSAVNNACYNSGTPPLMSHPATLYRFTPYCMLPLLDMLQFKVHLYSHFPQSKSFWQICFEKNEVGSLLQREKNFFWPWGKIKNVAISLCYMLLNDSVSSKVCFLLTLTFLYKAV